MNIYIPSRGRPFKQPVAEMLKQAKIPFKIVISENDPTARAYVTEWGTRIVVVRASGIAEKRQKIIDMSGGKLLMIDDDLRFYTRNAKDDNYHKMTVEEMKMMVNWFDFVLTNHAHAGLVDKFMSQATPRGTVGSRRYNQVLGYNLRLFPTPLPRFRIPINEEHDMHLQLAAHGHMPIICTEYSKSAAYNTDGGCSTWRNAKVEEAAHRKFAELWPDLVTLVPAKKAISGIGIRVKWRASVKEEA